MAWTPATIAELPEHCQTCGLFQNAKTWCVSPEVDPRLRTETSLKDKPFLLVVGEPVRAEEDQQGRPFVDPRVGSEFVRTFLNHLDVPWILTNSVRCFPGRDPASKSDNAPTDQQVGLCASNYLAQTVLRHQPPVIVALGAVAMRAVLGKSSPKSLSAAGKGPIQLPDSDTWVLVTKAPINHVNGRGDLREEYLRVFKTAEELVLGRGKEIEIDFTTVRTPEHALQVADQLGKEIVLDIEDAHQSEIPRMRTPWHPDSSFLCMVITDLLPGCRRENWIFTPQSLAMVQNIYGRWCATPRTRQILARIFAGRICWAHNDKYDFQGLFTLCDFDIFGAIAAWDDTLQELYLADQGKVGNSLKNQGQILRGMADWSVPVWAQVDAVNRIYQERNANDWTALVMAENARREEHGMRLLTEEDFKRGSVAHFGDVDPITLHRSCATDGDVTGWIIQEHLPRLPAQERALPIARELARRNCYTLCMVERRGLPVDEERFQALKVATDRKIDKLNALLLRQPAIQQALARIPDVQKRAKKGALELEHCLEAMNVKSPKFFAELADATGVRHSLPKTKKGNIRTNWEVLEVLSGENPKVPDNHKFPSHWIWHYFYKLRELRDLKSKFLAEIENYTVNGRIHTDYAMAKVEVAGRDAGGDKAGGAGTGRLSSRDPNLQNLKKDDVLRSIFRAPEGYYFGEFDYDRIEPVCLTAVTKCAAWEDVFHRGLDLYRVIANQVYHLGISLNGPDEEVDRRLTRLAPGDYEAAAKLEKHSEGCPCPICESQRIRDGIKTRTLAIMYDETPEAFAARAGISEGEALEFYANFEKAFPEIPKWKDEIRTMVRDRAKIITLFERQRFFVLTDNEYVDSKVFRQAINFPIQSLASDITLWKAFEILWHWLAAQRLEAEHYLNNLVHDSTWTESLMAKFHAHFLQHRTIMEDMTTLPFPFKLPLRVTWKVGPSLGQMVEMDRNLCVIPKHRSKAEKLGIPLSA